eukprot:529616-Pyramimonas_sp.AAC.1
MTETGALASERVASTGVCGSEALLLLMPLRIDRADQISKFRTVDKVNRLAINAEITWTIRGGVDEGGGQ